MVEPKMKGKILKRIFLEIKIVSWYTCINFNPYVSRTVFFIVDYGVGKDKDYNEWDTVGTIEKTKQTIKRGIKIYYTNITIHNGIDKIYNR